MSKEIKKPKKQLIAQELDPDLKAVFDSNESEPARLMVVLTQMIRYLKKIK